MQAIIQFKRSITSVYNFSIVMSKLSHLQEPGLIILFKMNKNLKIVIYYIFLLFSLAIFL